MKLSILARAIPGARLVGDDVEVRAIRSDSRQLDRGDLFVAVRGRRSDGHDFLPVALARGAAAVVVEREQPGFALPQLVVDDGARALGYLVAALAGEPGERMTLIGITGTNGKTTTTYLVESILAAAEARPGVIGTVDYRWNGRRHDAPYTTPTPDLLHDTFGRMVRDGVSHAVMEVSSAALAMERVAGVFYQVAAFSNLTQDHLDLHGSMADYAAAKQLLFSRHLAAGGVAVVNVDDPAGASMAAAAGTAAAKVLRVSSEDRAELRDEQRDAEIRVVSHVSSVHGLRARIRTPRGELDVASRPLLGHYNLANIALAVGIAEALGLDHAAIARGIEALPGVPGRVERVENAAGLDLLVDYAHTPDALDNVLRALRPLTQRRLICVFGCGGDRDPGKRPQMGAVVAALADLAIVTSDNPRTEDPRAILDAILPAVPAPFYVDVDRRTAIAAAIAEATPGDIVVIAGKGHEDYQIIGTTKVHFDDREEAAAAASRRPTWDLAELAAALRTTHHATAHGAGSISRITIDSRTAAPGDLYVAIAGERVDGHDFVAQAVANGAVAALVKTGRSPSTTPSIEVDDPRAALGAIAAAHRQTWRDGTALVAITGSAGKTTTKELTRAALAAAGPTHAALGSHNNETGLPLTLLGLRAHHRYGVVEMGMRGAGQIDYLTRIARPDVAAIVNAGVAHLELLGSTAAIAAAKAEIYGGLAEGGTAIVPADDARLIDPARRFAPQARLVTFGEPASADVRLAGYQPIGPTGADLNVVAFGQHRRFRLPLIGRHAAIDATCALACALAVGVELDVAIAGLERARAATMRGEVVTIGGRQVIVDCYNANPASMAAAIDTLAELRGSGRAVAVVGDMLELGDTAAALHADVGARLGELGIPVIALGAHRQRVADATGDPAQAWVTDDPQMAARQVLAVTEPGDWVLVKASRGMRLERVVRALQELVS